MNCSHRRDGILEEVYPRLRKYIAASGRKVEVLGDLQGPKFRVGETLNDEPVEIKNGESVQFGLQVGDTDLTRPGRLTMLPTIEQTALVKGTSVGETLLFDDGKLAIKCTEKTSDTELVCLVTVRTAASRLAV